MNTKAKLPSEISTHKANNEKPAVPAEAVAKMDKNAKQAILISAAGVATIIALVVVLSIGNIAWALPLLGLGALFANIGFLKAMRIRSRTKSRKRSYSKARRNAKTALILSCVLGVTLILGLLTMLADNNLT